MSDTPERETETPEAETPATKAEASTTDAPEAEAPAPEAEASQPEAQEPLGADAAAAQADDPRLDAQIPRWRSWVLPTAVLCFLGALVSSLAGPDSIRPLGEILAATGLALFGAEMVLSWRSVSSVVMRRSTLYDLNALLQVAMVLGIVVMANHLAWRKSERAWWMPKWDWTADGIHTFSKQTDQTMRRLSRRKKPVQVTAFFLNPRGNSNQERLMRAHRDEIRRLLERYAQRSDNFAYKLVDPEAEPLLAKQYEVNIQGTIVLETEDRKLEVIASELFTGNPRFGQKRRFKGEQVITSKLLDLLDGTKRTVYFLVGHRERDPDKSDPEGYSLVRQGLEVEGIRIAKINLLIQDTIPDDCSALVVAGPRQDLTEHEIKIIRRYLDARRPALFMVDAAPFHPRLAQLLHGYGVKLLPNIVIEPSPDHHLAGRPIMPIADLNGHAITNPLIEDGMRVVFHEATALENSPLARAAYDVRTILQSSATAWGETDLANVSGGVQQDPGDIPAPLSLAFAISSEIGSNDGEDQKPSDELRMAVHGDSDYLTNANLPYPGNYDFFVNTLAWLTRDTDRITIRPKEFTERRAEIPDRDESRIWFGLIFGLPSIFLGLGFAVFWQRRAA